MSNFYVITKSWHILGYYETESGAKAALTRKWSKRYPDAKVISCEDFSKNEPMVESMNILNGKKIMIRASEKGGCCDPGTETYHSM